MDDQCCIAVAAHISEEQHPRMVLTTLHGIRGIMAGQIDNTICDEEIFVYAIAEDKEQAEKILMNTLKSNQRFRNDSVHAIFHMTVSSVELNNILNNEIAPDRTISSAELNHALNNKTTSDKTFSRYIQAAYYHEKFLGEEKNLKKSEEVELLESYRTALYQRQKNYTGIRPRVNLAYQALTEKDLHPNDDDDVKESNPSCCSVQ